MYTQEQKEAIVRAHGYDPADTDIADDLSSFFPKTTPVSPPSTAGKGMMPYDKVTPEQVNVSNDTPLQTFGKTLGQGAIPAVAGGVGAGATLAGLTGLGLSSTGIGAVAGIPLAILGGYLASRGAGAVQDAIEPDAWKENVAQSQALNPKSALAGNVATIPLSGFSPGKGALTAAGAIPKLLTGMARTPAESAALLNTGLNVGLQPVVDVAISQAEGRPLPTAKELALSAATGAVFSKPNALGRRMGFPSEVAFDRNLPGREDVMPLEEMQALQEQTRLAKEAEEVQQRGATIQPATIQENPASSGYQKGKKFIPQKSAEDSALEMQRLFNEKEVQKTEQMKLQTEQLKLQNEQRKIDYEKARKELENEQVQTEEALAKPIEISSAVQRPEIRPSVEEISTKQEPIVRTEEDILDTQQRNLEEKLSGETTKPTFRYQDEPQSKVTDPITSLAKKTKEDLETAGLSTTPKATWYNKLKDFGAEFRNVKLEPDDKLVNSQTGEPVAGAAMLRQGTKEALAKWNPEQAGLDTVPHELIGHLFLNDLRNSPKKVDKKFVSDFETLVKGDEEFNRINAEREKAELPKWDPEEFIASNQGIEFLRKRLSLDKETPFKTWWKDFGAHVKTRYTKDATMEDFRRLMNYRFENDAATVRETPVVNTTQGVFQRNQDESRFKKLKSDTVVDVKHSMSEEAALVAEVKQIIKRKHGIDLKPIEANNLIFEQDQHNLLRELLGDLDAAAIIDRADKVMKSYSMFEKVRTIEKIRKQSLIRNQDESPLKDDIGKKLGLEVKIWNPQVPGMEPHVQYTTKDGKTFYLKQGASEAEIRNKLEEKTKEFGEEKYSDQSPLKDKYSKLPSYDNTRSYEKGNHGEYWLDKNGNMIPVRGHQSFSAEYQNKEKSNRRDTILYDDLFNKGWNRAVVDKRRLYLDGWDKPSDSVLSKLKDIAIENNLHSIEWQTEGGKPVILWEKESNVNDDGVRYSSMSPLKAIRPEVTKVREDFGPEGVTLAGDNKKGFEGFYKEYTRLQGKLQSTGDLTKYIKKTSPKEFLTNTTDDLEAVGKYMLDRSYGNKTSKTLTPEQKAIEKDIRDNLVNSVNLKNAEPGLRKTIPDPEYYPQVPKDSVLQTLLNERNSTEGKKLQKDFLDYQTTKLGKTLQEAKDNLKTFFEGYNKQEVSLAEQFGPVDKAAGVGIPPSWAESSPVKVLNRFNNRYARRIAYHRAIESQPDVMKALGELETADTVKNVFQDIQGKTEHNEAFRSAVSGVVRAGMMGTLTGAKDFVSNFTLGFQHLTPAQTITSAVDALTNFKDNWKRSFETGVNRHNIGTLEYGEGGIDGVSSLLRRTRDVLNSVQGRNILEQSNRTIAFGQGKFTAMKNLSDASKGNLSGIQKKFLDDFAPDWQKYRSKGAFPNEVLNEVAANYAESVQGLYDYTGLPAFATKGSLAPVLSLARWNIEKFNNFQKYVVKPARQGDIKPLLMSTLGMLIGGTAITKLVEEATGKKEKTPKWEEIQAAKEQGEDVKGAVAYKLAALSSMAGYAGILGDLIKSALDVQNKNRPQTYNNPLVDFVSNGARLMSEVTEAAASGDLDLTSDLIGQVLEDYMQGYRLAITQLSPEKKEEIEKTNRYRDLKNYKKLTGQPVTTYDGSRPNPFKGKDLREFKKSGDVAEASELLPDLIEKAFSKAGDDPELLKAELQKIKQSSYQTMPNPETMPLSFAGYLQFLSKSQGPEKAQEALFDYFRQNSVNKAKSSLVPTL